MKWFLFFSFLFNLNAQALEGEELIYELESLNNFLNQSSHQSCQILEDQNEATFIRAQDSHQNLFNCADAKTFKDIRANSSWKYCRPVYGEEAWTCSESDKMKISKRMQDKQLMKRIQNFAESKFHEYKTRLAQRCCAPNAKNCLNRFEKLKLTFKESHSSTAEYLSDSAPVNFGTNEIRISTAKLASQYTEEALERVLLHEFGHVCQFALISEDESLYREFTSPNTRCLASTGEKGFKVANLKTQSCVNEKLKKQMQGVSGNYCFGKWYREAFADMVFRDEMNTLYHWMYDMYRVSPSTNYGSVYEYIQCDMENFPMEKTCN